MGAATIEGTVGPQQAVDPTIGPRSQGQRSAAREIVTFVAGVVLGLVALLAIVVAISTRMSGDGQFGLFGHPVMSVLSGSMAPTINTGDLVIDDKVTPAQATNLHAGQIISFRSGANSRQIFTHRIVAVESAPAGGVAYVTKGDANGSRDGPVAPSTNVVALYQAKIPDGGYVLNALHRPLVLGLILGSPLLWLLSEPLWMLARKEDASTGTPIEEGEKRP